MAAPIEILATVLALGYVLLAIKAVRGCFVLGGLSALLYGFIFWQVQLYMEASLQVFYVAISVYGWCYWHQPDRATPISQWPMRQHLKAVTGILAASTGMGVLLSTYTDAALPFADSFTTISALTASWLVARKILENWLYWVVIDLISVALFFYRDLQLTAGLFVVYTALAALGYAQWRRQWQAQSPAL